MSRGTKTSDEQVVAILDAASTAEPCNAGGYLPTKAIARAVGVSHDTVNRVLARHAPVAEALRVYQRDAFVGGWQWMYLDTLAAVQDRINEGKLTFSERQSAAITMGIATEKTLLVTGQPTQITAEIHEVRLRLPELVGKLAAVAKRLPASTLDTPAKND